MAMLLLVVVFVESILGALQATKSPDARVDDINVFLTMAWQVARHIQPNSSCYVCGFMPYTAGEGLPLMALPASDCDTCHLLHIPFSQSYAHPECPRLSKMRPLNCSGPHSNCNRCLKTPKPVPVQLIPQSFSWCLENDGTASVGESDCLHTFKWDPRHPDNEFQSVKSRPQQCLEKAGPTRLNALAHVTAICSVSAPVGMYWVCGNLAYPYLPVDYKGRCGLAYVIPAMRVTQSLPKKPHSPRLKRAVSDLFWTHHQSPFKNALGSLLPFYGVMSSLDQIADLSHAIETIANETSRALMLMSSELASVRLLALQNRAALDFLLAARGGTCSVIGSECCTFVPDYNITIDNIITHLHDTAHFVHQENSSLFDWLRPTFGSFTHHIIEGVIIFLVITFIFYLIVSCIRKFLCNID
ncbi:syncytin-A-like [Hippocampus zosterae]|uniref:syncytin-A-like n=1 Tax=Hippocampus zosterae TaxID=109293 RepID=UPI00223E3FEF|nr:syncytin-A-like [Hippocampus zosterae]